MWHFPEGKKPYQTCDWCDAEPIVFVYSAAANVEVCWEHAKSYGFTTEWLETNQMPFLNHVEEAKVRQLVKDGVPLP